MGNGGGGGGGPRNSPGQQSSQVSTTTLLNALHNTYTSSQPYQLDASTSLVVNTWLTAAQGDGGVVDAALAARAWEHARRRAEDGCIMLGSLHESAPSVMVPFLSTLPLKMPASLYTSLNVLRPFTHAVSPYNGSTPLHSALGVTLTLTLDGHLTGASLALSQGGIDTARGLLNVPAEPGHRAFDVFYYLLTSASTAAEREFLGLKPPSTYALLARSGTYDPPSYLATADDSAAAEDFRASLKEIGIKGSAHRNLISMLIGILKLGDTLSFNLDGDALEEVCEDIGGLLGLDPELLVAKCTTGERETLVGALYEAVVDWVVGKANSAIALEMLRSRGGENSSDSERTPGTDEDNGDTVCITVLEVPGVALGKAAAMRGVFDDTQGINAEMKEDGVDVVAAGSSVLREMENAVAEVGPDLGIMSGPAGREREHARDRREAVLEKVGREGEEDGFLKSIVFPVDGEGVNLGRQGRLDLATVLGSSRVWYHLSMHPIDDAPGTLVSLPSTTSAWSAGTVSRQLRAWRLPEWANRRTKNLDFTADFDHDEFAVRYASLGCKDGRDGVESWVMERGWTNGEVVVGRERVWMREGAWWEAESMFDLTPAGAAGASGDYGVLGDLLGAGGYDTGYSAGTHNQSGFFNAAPSELHHQDSREGFLQPGGDGGGARAKSVFGAASKAPTRAQHAGDYGLGFKGDNMQGHVYYNNELGEFVDNLDPELANPKAVVSDKVTFSRRLWVGFVWALTFWIPSFLLRYVGRMKRPDVRMAWREKVVLVFIIFLINGIIVFYIVVFGRLLCPNFDKVWDTENVATHQGDNDFWVSIHGKVYDITKFWKQDHGTTARPVQESDMGQLRGLNLDAYFMPPLTQSCPGLVTEPLVYIQQNGTQGEYSWALHDSGSFRDSETGDKMHDWDWYWKTFQPRMEEFYKGHLVTKTDLIKSDGEDNSHYWFTLDGAIYDLNNYFYTVKTMGGQALYDFLDEGFSTMVKNNPGQDLTEAYALLLSKATDDTQVASIKNSLNCVRNTFYIGIPDFRWTPRCQVNNYILLAFTIILCCVIGVKFLAALQFGSKRRPAAQDKFVICQVPAYTEGEESLRKALDSLTALQYDNKRKLICVICDGMIVGGGNDRPTPKIVLDILGVDPKIDPPALPFHSVGQSGEQLNYGKVYSGLYEFEGSVVPYIVIVKVGKESEQSKSKPGNRGKRDSQILLMSFLNRVHHRSPMNPLELEMFHQINNIIGVDPELYEYLFMVDADTSVREDSLNRLVAACANDAKIAGVCGETSLENEEKSWWTMIQVYEYFISHHLAKAFESLFGSVTCLPGCFTMYRLRTADKGKPLLISDAIVREYADCDVDTLHKKNLLSLGEDRFLTTLMTKHFPYMSYKFIPDAYASTAAPDTWSVLLSQRRRWINSTIHNLAELVRLREMCGFCCFSMRFVVFIDLFGTVILPATCVYLIYLITTVALGKSQFPLISIIMIAAVYGLQAVIFILKRQWQHVGWMIIYILAFPIYSFVLPVYSFWNQDNFTWGSTRIVIGESGDKRLVAIDDDGFDPRSIPLQRWDDYAAANALPGRRVAVGAGGMEKLENPYDDAYEMDDFRSVYSSVKPASTMGFGGGQGARSTFIPPPLPSPYSGAGVQASRQSVFSTSPYADHAAQPGGQAPSMLSLGAPMDGSPSPYGGPVAGAGGRPSTIHVSRLPSSENLLGGMGSPSPGPGPGRGNRNTIGYLGSGAGGSSTALAGGGPSDEAIVEAIRACLADVDLDTVTKKQVRALVEQRLGGGVGGVERRAFVDRAIDGELASM
ncbi:hypothetical protein V494_02029 [Pseudogymnoascus sp. VKM F-4513 (FW-928)]|nr:hypothetical protein V494_02029 [Pseudogymnoascus sp. VKM F-4513 (FW-928)]